MKIQGSNPIGSFRPVCTQNRVVGNSRQITSSTRQFRQHIVFISPINMPEPTGPTWSWRYAADCRILTMVKRRPKLGVRNSCQTTCSVRQFWQYIVLTCLIKLPNLTDPTWLWLYARDHRIFEYGENPHSEDVCVRVCFICCGLSERCALCDRCPEITLVSPEDMNNCIG